MVQLGIPFMGSSFSDGAVVPVGTPNSPGGIPVRAKEELTVVGGVGGVVSGGGVSSGERERVLHGGGGGGGGGGPKLEGGRAQLMKKQRGQQSFIADAPVSLPLEGGDGGAVLEDGGDDGRQGSFKADAPFSLEDDVKLEEDRRELMTKQQVQSSFVADAPVSLEQVNVESVLTCSFVGISTETRCASRRYDHESCAGSGQSGLVKRIAGYLIYNTTKYFFMPCTCIYGWFGLCGGRHASLDGRVEVII